MPVIFPGSSTHDRSTNSTTTKHLLWIADALNTWGRGGSKLTAQGRKFIEDVLYPYGNKPGPLDWRYFLERKCGSGDELLQYVKDAKGLLDRMLTVAVEDQAVTRFREIAQHLHRAMRDEPVNGRMRLRWLCCDMISRLESETEDCGIGNIDPRINEAAGLAVLLEFESAPIQRTRYERDGNCTIEPFVGSTWPEPVSWISLRHGHPEFVYLFGYRLHDPAGGFPVDIPMAALVEGTDPEKRKKYDPWASNSKSEHRTTIAKLLKRRVSEIDGLSEAVTERRTVRSSERGVHLQFPSTSANLPGNSKYGTGGRIRVDQRTRRAFWKTTILKINQQTDFDVLARLTEEVGAVVSHLDLYRAVRPSALHDDTITFTGADPAVKDVVHHINTALKAADCPWDIRAVRRKGYQLLYHEESTQNLPPICL